MYTKEELHQKQIAELVEIARSLNIMPESIESEEEAIEKIIAAQDAAAAEPVKRTRKRVLKKDTTDHVYSVNGTDGENLDTKQAKRKAKAAASIFVTDIESEKKPKRRTKKAAAEEESIANDNALPTPDTAITEPASDPDTSALQTAEMPMTEQPAILEHNNADTTALSLIHI